MTKLQTLLITLLLACVIHSKILVLDMEDLRQLSASENPNLLRSLLSPSNAAHKGKVCYDRYWNGWIGGFDEANNNCLRLRCMNLATGLENTKTITCTQIN